MVQDRALSSKGHADANSRLKNWGVINHSSNLEDTSHSCHVVLTMKMSFTKKPMNPITMKPMAVLTVTCSQPKL